MPCASQNEQDGLTPSHFVLLERHTSHAKVALCRVEDTLALVDMLTCSLAPVLFPLLEMMTFHREVGRGELFKATSLRLKLLYSRVRNKL